MPDAGGRETASGEKFRSGYLFFGEEVYPAYQFVEKLNRKLSSSDPEIRSSERFVLGVDSWKDIIDSARTVSLFSSGKLILVEKPEVKRDSAAAGRDSSNTLENQLIKEYFADPPQSTVLVVVAHGRLRKTSPLVKLFLSLESSGVQVTEMKPLRGNRLHDWIRNRFREEGKSVDPDAVLRLIELAGGDLQRLDNEIKKILTYLGEERNAGLDDVNQCSGWVKSFVEWEFTEGLEKADFRRCLLSLSQLLEKEGVSGVRILGLAGGFFRDILLVKLRLKEDGKDRKSIFREVKPQIPEKFRDLYEKQYRILFQTADSLTLDQMNGIFKKLEEVDMLLKTSTVPFKNLMEGFLFDYCRMRRKSRSIWKGAD